MLKCCKQGLKRVIWSELGMSVPRPIETTWGLAAFPQLLQQVAGLHPLVRSYVGRWPPAPATAPVTCAPCATPSSLVSGYSEAPCMPRSLLLRPSREGLGSGADEGPRGPFRASDATSEAFASTRDEA